MFTEIDWLGDVHLGRSFNTGVPLHRRGDREHMVMTEFSDRVMNPKSKIHIQVGDLFDSFKVAAKWVLGAALIYKAAAAQNTDVQYFVIRGNHDGSRDRDEKGAMDLFEELMISVPNVTVVTKPTVYKGIALFPWDPFMTSSEVADELKNKHYVMAVGHWDTGGYGVTSNLIPYGEFVTGCNTVVTGHVHTPDRFRSNSCTVHVIGSMQPYSHAEDPTGDWYLTLTADQLTGYTEDLTMKNVRVLLREGEELPTDINCLALVGKLIAEQAEGQVDETVSVADFDFKKIFIESMLDVGVPKNLAAQLWDIQEKSND